nr:peptide transporter family 1-like isoform X1 [Cherax quadricarinatus]
MWLIPQYFIITVSEIMFSITGLEFSFTQSPSSMKSVLQAAWLLTVSFGNLIVVIIAEAKFFKSQNTVDCKNDSLSECMPNVLGDHQVIKGQHIICFTS